MTSRRAGAHRHGRFCISPSPWLGARPTPQKDPRKPESKEK